LLDVNEKGFIPWKKIAIVTTLAAIQIAGGGLLMATPFGY
jgi:hypothetical protein